MSNCGNCCGSCGGCGELILSKAELTILDELSQIPFLPVARTREDETPIFPDRANKETSLALLCLEKRGLITIDFDRPLTCGHSDYPICGSIALTAKGIHVLELLDIQGLES